MLNLNLKLMGNSPFKMKYSGKGQGVPALMKALVGNQDRLPEKLKKAIKDAPETPKKKTSRKDSPVKSYGSKKKSPVMNTDDPTKKEKKGKEYVPVDLSDRQHLSDALKAANITVKDGIASGKGDRSRINPRTGLPESDVLLRQLQNASNRINKSRKRTHDLKVGNMAVDPQKNSQRVIGDEARREADRLNKVRTGQLSLDSAATMTTKEQKEKLSRTSPARSYGSKKKSPAMMKGVKGLKNQRGKK